VPGPATRFQESEAAFSQNGRWQVSDEGGAYARWSANGRELYYRTDEGIMVVSVTGPLIVPCCAAPVGIPVRG
jgi:hypothetical protein